MVSFFKMLKQSLRNYNQTIYGFTPAQFDKKTFILSETFMKIIYISHNGRKVIDDQIGKFHMNENERLKKENTVSSENICYHFKDQRLNQSELRLHREIYEILLYHHQQQQQS